MLVENSIAELKTVREAPFGVFLDAGTGNTSDDVLLHKGQQTAPVKIGDTVRVFLYHDPHHRLTASMRLPKIEIGDIGYAEIINTTRFGAFVDVGTERGIFLPFSEMIGRVTAGDKVWVRLYEDKSGRLAMTMHVEMDMQNLAQPAKGIKVGGKIQGTVYNITRDGAFIITREKWIAFLHRSDMPRTLHAGEEITGRVTRIREDGRLNISLRPQKEKAIEGDMAVIMKSLEGHDGVLPWTEKSAPEIIKANLGLSKAAFKRAVGHLMKQGDIEITDGRIRLARK